MDRRILFGVFVLVHLPLTKANVPQLLNYPIPANYFSSARLLPPVPGLREFLQRRKYARDLTASNALVRKLCYVDGELSPYIRDRKTCLRPVPEGEVGKNLYVEQTFNGKEWIINRKTPQCPTHYSDDGFPVCGSFAITVKAASPTGGQTRAFARPPPTNKCELEGFMWTRVKGRLRCTRRRSG